MKIAQLSRDFPDHHLRPDQCLAFFTKLHNDILLTDNAKEFESIKEKAHAKGGLLSYTNPMLDMINKNISMINKIIAAKLYGSIRGTQLNEIGLSKTYTTNNSMTFPTPGDRKVPDTDCLDNRLTLAAPAVHYGQSSVPGSLSVNGQQCQELSQGSQNNWQASSQQHRGKKCLVCMRKRHYNLIQCPNLREYIPMGSNVKTTHKAICSTCLGTVFQDGANCNHAGQKNYLKTFCDIGRCSYLLCRHCTKHHQGHRWFMDHHDPKAGFKNYVQIVRDLTQDVVNSFVQ